MPICLSFSYHGWHQLVVLPVTSWFMATAYPKAVHVGRSLCPGAAAFNQEHGSARHHTDSPPPTIVYFSLPKALFISNAFPVRITW